MRAMIVAEVIEALRMFPPEAPARIVPRGCWRCPYHPTDGVAVTSVRFRRPNRSSDPAFAGFEFEDDDLRDLTDPQG